MKTTVNVEFKKIQTGIFDAYVDGVKTPYGIVNGCLGMTGRDTINTYGVTKNGVLVRWLGPLNTCKKMAAYILGKKAGQ